MRVLGVLAIVWALGCAEQEPQPHEPVQVGPPARSLGRDAVVQATLHTADERHFYQIKNDALDFVEVFLTFVEPNGAGLCLADLTAIEAPDGLTLDVGCNAAAIDFLPPGRTVVFSLSGEAVEYRMTVAFRQPPPPEP